MRLLIITQKVDKEDPILGFFHSWISELSKNFEAISVICLEKGNYNLPQNVTVFSLGKESTKSKLKYLTNFFRYILGLHADYDAVFVHMNQEYIVLSGFLWKVMRKKVFFWRNHISGNIFTRIAVWFSDKVFCTSKFAFVAKYKKTSLMPVGIDTEKFKDGKMERLKDSILFLGRMSPIKRPELLIEALGILNKKNTNFTCDFYGDALPKDEEYFTGVKNKVKDLGLGNQVKFHKAVPNYEAPKIYNEHEIFVNLTPSGSFDKTILEAAVCGCLLVVANKSLAGEIDERMIAEENPRDIADRINFWLAKNDEEKMRALEVLQKYVIEKHSLDALVDKLAAAFI